MPTLIDHLLVFLLVLVLPIYTATRGRKQMEKSLAENAPGVRVRTYWWTIIPQWIATTILLTTWYLADRSSVELGLGIPTMTGFWIAVGACLVFGAIIQYQQYCATRTDKARQDAWQEIQQAAAFLPRDRRDMEHFTALSFTAGACEEIIYRGFLIWYATQFTGESVGGLILAVVLTASVFAAGHLYQGVRGASHVLVFGLVTGGLFAATGTLWPLILLHIYADVTAGVLGLRLWRTTGRILDSSNGATVATD